ncbi:hypothetical protein CYY_005578 [Polysphondylium violaceum]|uniref:Uncharacterized protein n=1 Tax=Polysphondylium violaceum TaxID=133409 RepID=A0A8J4V6Q7_9MYCE|nr:hypothetical protein CYY_005578 [Polysphondylium violaceum]
MISNNIKKEHGDETMANLFGKQQFTEEETNRIQALLGQRPSALNKRTITGDVQSYYLTHKQISDEANAIFGASNWSFRVVSISNDIIDRREEDAEFFIFISAHGRVSLKDGSFRDNLGTGSARLDKTPFHNTIPKVIASAKKKAVTDCFKRCVSMFGPALGNGVKNIPVADSVNNANKRIATNNNQVNSNSNDYVVVNHTNGNSSNSNGNGNHYNHHDTTANSGTMNKSPNKRLADNSAALEATVPLKVENVSSSPPPTSTPTPPSTSSPPKLLNRSPLQLKPTLKIHSTTSPTTTTATSTVTTNTAVVVPPTITDNEDSFSFGMDGDVYA